MDKKKSPTWILFESGNALPVDLGLYTAATQSNRPIDAYIVAECEGDFTRAARRAADVVFHIFKEKYDTKPLVVGYDIETIGGQSLTGGSGGLSFAIALAKALYSGKDPGPVAATGEIYGGGKLRAIKGINEKSKAAINFLPRNAYFFFPEENTTEIDDDLFITAKQKGINFIGVSTVKESLEILFGWGDKKNKRNNIGHDHKLLKSWPILCLLAALLIFWFGQKNIQPKSAKKPSMPKIIKEVIIEPVRPIKIATAKKKSDSSPIISKAGKEEKIKIEESRQNTAKQLTLKPAQKENSKTKSWLTINLTGYTDQEKFFIGILKKEIEKLMKAPGEPELELTLEGKVSIYNQNQPLNSDGSRFTPITMIKLYSYQLKQSGETKHYPDIHISKAQDNWSDAEINIAAKELAQKIIQALNIKEFGEGNWPKARPSNFSPLK